MSGKPMWEALGFLAVVAGLVFVGVEIRQNTMASRAAAYQALGIALTDYYAGIVHDRELIDVTSGGREQMSPGDWEQMAVLWAGWLALTETALLQVEQGVLPPEAMERLGFRNARGQWLTQSPTFGCVWPGLRVNVSQALRAHIEDGADPPDCTELALPDWLRGG